MPEFAARLPLEPSTPPPPREAWATQISPAKSEPVKRSNYRQPPALPSDDEGNTTPPGWSPPASGRSPPVPLSPAAKAKARAMATHGYTLDRGMVRVHRPAPTLAVQWSRDGSTSYAEVPSGWSPPTSGRSPTRRRPGSAPARAKTGASKPAGRAEVLQLCDWVQRELSLLEDDGDELAELEVWDAAMEQASAQAGAHCAERGKLFELVRQQYLGLIERQAEQLERQGDELDEARKQKHEAEQQIVQQAQQPRSSLTGSTRGGLAGRLRRATLEMPDGDGGGGGTLDQRIGGGDSPSGRRSTMSKRVSLQSSLLGDRKRSSAFAIAAMRRSSNASAGDRRSSADGDAARRVSRAPSIAGKGLRQLLMSTDGGDRTGALRAFKQSSAALMAKENERVSAALTMLGEMTPAHRRAALTEQLRNLEPSERLDLLRDSMEKLTGPERRTLLEDQLDYLLEVTDAPNRQRLATAAFSRLDVDSQLEVLDGMLPMVPPSKHAPFFASTLRAISDETRAPALAAALLTAEAEGAVLFSLLTERGALDVRSAAASCPRHRDGRRGLQTDLSIGELDDGEARREAEAAARSAEDAEGANWEERAIARRRAARARRRTRRGRHRPVRRGVPTLLLFEEAGRAGAAAAR